MIGSEAAKSSVTLEGMLRIFLGEWRWDERQESAPVVTRRPENSGEVYLLGLRPLHTYVL